MNAQATYYPNVGGVPIGDFFYTTGLNFIHGGFQTVWAIIGYLLVLLALAKVAKVPIWLSSTLAFGGLWAGWLAWNTWKGVNNPLFPGSVQVQKLWQSVTTSPLALLIVVIAVGSVFLLAKTSTLGIKLLLATAALFAGSFVYNLLVNINWQMA